MKSNNEKTGILNVNPATSRNYYLSLLFKRTMTLKYGRVSMVLVHGSLAIELYSFSQGRDRDGDSNAPMEMRQTNFMHRKGTKMSEEAFVLFCWHKAASAYRLRVTATRFKYKQEKYN